MPPPPPTAVAEAATLVGPIYDTVLDQNRWTEVLGLCRDFVGGQSASIFAKDETGMAGGIFFYDGRLSEPYPQLYFDTYVHLDPSTGGHLLTPLERPVSIADILDISEFYDTRFYREWVEPQVAGGTSESFAWNTHFHGTRDQVRNACVGPGRVLEEVVDSSICKNTNNGTAVDCNDAGNCWWR